MAKGSRLNLEHRRKQEPMTNRMEWLGHQHNQSVAEGSKLLLKAQLTTGQHTLDKDRFVQTAIHHGWILAIPEQLLV